MKLSAVATQLGIHTTPIGLETIMSRTCRADEAWEQRTCRVDEAWEQRCSQASSAMQVLLIMVSHLLIKAVSMTDLTLIGSEPEVSPSLHIQVVVNHGSLNLSWEQCQ